LKPSLEYGAEIVNGGAEMKQSRQCALFLIVSMILIASSALSALAQSNAKPMTNDDVISMVKASLPEDTIITAIGSQATNFDISAAGLVNLKKEGVSAKVMDAMLAAAGKTAAPAAPSAAPYATAEAPPAAAGTSIPAGTSFLVRTIDAIDSETAKQGQTFHASLEQPLVVNDQTIAPKGADVYLKLEAVKQSGKIMGAAELTVAVASIMIDGNATAVNTDSVTNASEGRGKQSATRIGVGTAAGAVLGGIFGGGKGAAIGAGAGAATGTAIQVMTKGPHVTIQPETLLTFTVGSGAN
jgi:YMGG-like Gly-zipper